MARRPTSDSRSEAEKAFKAVTTKPAELPPKAPALPHVKHTVTLRVDQDVLDYFQQDGIGSAGPHERSVAQGGWKIRRR